MTTILERTPMTESLYPAPQSLNPVADALAGVLNDTYRLVVKSHTYHWNVTGPLFVALHDLTEEHYTNMFTAADVIAERIRAMGMPASVNLADLSKDSGATLSATEMIKDLLADHENLTHRLHALIEIAESKKDAVTADLATERTAFHEKAAWMLRAMAV